MILSPASAFPLDANTLRWLGWNAQLLRRFALSNAPERCSHDGAMFAPRFDWDLQTARGLNMTQTAVASTFSLQVEQIDGFEFRVKFDKGAVRPALTRRAPAARA
jgi:hypothetical protein